MSRWLATLAVLAACAPATDDAPVDASVSEVEVSGAVTDASCATTDHPLRFRCTLSTDAAADVAWTVTEDGSVVRTFATTGTAHEVLLWGLPEGTDLRWEASLTDGSASGALTTGAADVGDFTVSTSGELAADSVLVPLQCDDRTGLVAFDGAGRVTWYEVVGDGDGRGSRAGVQGFDLSPGGFVVGIDGEEVVEVGPDGTELRRLSGFANPLHHDLAVDDDGRIYVLEASADDGYVVDAIRVFEGTEQVALLDTGAALTPVGSAGQDRYWSDLFPSAIDWAHTNSVELAGDGSALLSMKAQNAIVSVDLDPASASFGEVLWTLTGDDSELTSDLPWDGSGGFFGQHHASFDAEGRVMLFDNGEQTSRGLVLGLDGDAASEIVSLDLDTHCPTQGSTYALPDGGWLVTCANAGEVVAFDPSGARVWEAQVSCGQGLLARAMPLSW